MLAYVIRRLALAIPTLLLAAVAVFLMLRLIPGDPALIYVGDADDPAMIEAARRQFGLDRSLVEQFMIWIWHVLSGDLGTSIKTGDPVFAQIARSFPVTAQIVLLSTALAAAVAVPAGMLAAWRQNSKIDILIVGFATLCLSIPSFWLALLLLVLFGATLGWLPTVGYVSVFDDPIKGGLYLVMPVLALLLTELATLTRMSRSSTIEVLRLEYITYARSKGLSESAVLWRHAFPNAFAPTLTILGLLLGNLLSGIVVIETMFSIPGLGRLMVSSIFARDYPVVQGVLLFVVVLTITINLIVDLLYPLFDPRVRL